MGYSNKPLVSICSITYNHKNYISQAIEGFLMQKTNFPFEILIHDDASTDGTAKIIKDYAKKHPDKITAIFQKENQYSKGKAISSTFVRPRAKGKYIALCEGDDYWTDPYKLQKQVDFLETNRDYGLVHSDCDILYQMTGKLIKSINKFRKKDFTEYTNPFYGILTGDYVIMTLTVLMRKDLILKSQKCDIYRNSGNLQGDLPLWLEASQHTKFHYIDKSMAVYRKRAGSASNQLNKKDRISFQESSKRIRLEFAEKYNVPKEIKIKVKKMYYNVMLTKAYYYYDRSLAKKYYKLPLKYGIKLDLKGKIIYILLSNKFLYKISKFFLIIQRLFFVFLKIVKRDLK